MEVLTMKQYSEQISEAKFYLESKINIEQVIEVANKTRPKFISLVKEVINEVCL